MLLFGAPGILLCICMRASSLQPNGKEYLSDMLKGKLSIHFETSAKQNYRNLNQFSGGNIDEEQTYISLERISCVARVPTAHRKRPVRTTQKTTISTDNTSNNVGNIELNYD